MLHILMNHLLTKVSPRIEEYGTYSGPEQSLEWSGDEAVAHQPDAAQGPDAFVQVFEGMQEPKTQEVQDELVEVLAKELSATAGPALAYSDEVVGSKEATVPLDSEMRAESSERTSRSVSTSRREPNGEQVHSVQTAGSIPNRQDMPAATTAGEHTVPYYSVALELDDLEQESPSVFPQRVNLQRPSPETAANHSSLVTKSSVSQIVLHSDIAKEIDEPPELEVPPFAGRDAASAAGSRTGLTPDNQVAAFLKRNTIPPGFALPAPAEQNSSASHNQKHAIPAAIRSELPVQSELLFDDKQDMRAGYNATRSVEPPATSGMLPFEQSDFVPSEKRALKSNDQNSIDIHLSEPSRAGKAQDDHIAVGPKTRHQNVLETPSKTTEWDGSADFETRKSSKTKVELPRAAALTMPPLAPPSTDRNFVALNPAKIAGDVSPDNTSLFLTTGSVELANPARSSAAHFFNAPETPRQVSQQIAMAMRAGVDSSVEIILKPVELGRVQISISTSDTSVVVHVAAERPETMELLRRNIDQLASEFRDIGYGHSEFRFANGDPGNGQTKDDQSASHSDAKLDPKGRASQLTDQDPGVMISEARIDLDRVDIRI